MSEASTTMSITLEQASDYSFPNESRCTENLELSDIDVDLKLSDEEQASLNLEVKFCEKQVEENVVARNESLEKN